MEKQSTWKMTLANLLDYLALSAVFFLFFAYFDKMDSLFLITLLTFPFFLLKRAFFLSKLKSTLGHAFFGMKLTDESGNKVSFVSAWKSFFVKDTSSLVWSKKAVKWPFRMISAFALAICFMTFPFAGDYKGVRVAILEQMVGGWVECKSEEGGFTIQFPSTPVLEEKDLPLPSEDADPLHYSEYVSEPKKNHSYSISYITLPSKWTAFGARILLKEALSIFLKNNTGLKLLDKEFKEFAGYRVLDFTAMLGDEQVTGRLLIVDEKLYKLSVSHPKDTDQDLKIEEFMSSLNLK